MTAIMIILLVLIIIAFGINCYALGKTNGYIKGYEEASDYAIDEMKKRKKWLENHSEVIDDGCD